MNATASPPLNDFASSSASSITTAVGVSVYTSS